jgi:transposase
MRYTEKKKLAATEDYCLGHDGLIRVAARHGVDVSSLRRWAAIYRSHGASGLARKKSGMRYSPEFKLKVVRRMQKEGLSDRQAAALFNVRNFNAVRDWMLQYDGVSVNSLSPGTVRKKPVVKNKPSSSEHRSREELLAEVSQLRMENAYLKKLDALVQAKTKLARQKKRKSCLN